jgi:ABC-type xylose transport system permease subunit
MGMPAPGIIWAILTIILWFMLRKTKFGREVYAVGSNPISSYLDTDKIRLLIGPLAPLKAGDAVGCL